MWCMLMHMMGHQDHQHGQDAPPAITYQPDESLLDILKRRFALGEITREQYEEMRLILGLTGSGHNVESPERRSIGR